MIKSRGVRKNYAVKVILFVLPAFMAIFLSYSFISSNASINKTIELSQKQLILLSNYVYFEDTDQLVTIQEKLNSMKTNGSYNPSLINSPSSGIKDSAAIEMFKAIESDKTLSNLVAVASIDTDIRAVAFVNKSCVKANNAEAVIVYQGTKGLNKPWLDNLEGAYHSDTSLQKLAGIFLDNVEKKYNVSYVTGHSKGGNLAQYVTVTRGENIRQCISYNGQGFSQLFITKYSTKLDANKHKITSICSYKEPVHALLTPIASNVMLIKTNEKLDPMSSHTSSHLYNKTFFDNNGNYKSKYLTEPTKTVELIEKICSYVVNNVDSTYLQKGSETISPVLSYSMSLMQDTISHEDMSLVEALCTELEKKQSENKTINNAN